MPIRAALSAYRCSVMGRSQGSSGLARPRISDLFDQPDRRIRLLFSKEASTTEVSEGVDTEANAGVVMLATVALWRWNETFYLVAKNGVNGRLMAVPF